MRKGRSGGFRLSRGDLGRLLDRFDADVVIGSTLEDEVTASDARRCLVDCDTEEVVVEEQDGSWYVLHFPEWVIVGEHSPLYRGFRRYHTQWLETVRSLPADRLWWQFWK